MVVSTSISENIEGLSKLLVVLEKNKFMQTLEHTMSTNQSPAQHQQPIEIKKALWRYSKNYVWLPIELEKLYGDQQHSTQINSILVENDRSKARYEFANKVLNDVLSKVKEPHDYKFKIYVRTNNEHNAAAIAGGYVYIDSGAVGGTDRNLLALRKEERDKLYDSAIFSISHEISHILQRHETKAIQARIMDSVDLVELTRLSANPQQFMQPDYLKNLLKPVLEGKRIFTKYHEDQELQADSCGVVLSSKVFDDKKRLQRNVDEFLKLLAKESDDHTKSNKSVVTPTKDGTPPELEGFRNGLIDIGTTLSDPVNKHPTTEMRSQNFKAMYTVLGLAELAVCSLDKTCGASQILTPAVIPTPATTPNLEPKPPKIPKKKPKEVPKRTSNY